MSNVNATSKPNAHSNSSSNNEEHSHLLETAAASTDKYGSNQADQENLISNMAARDANIKKLPQYFAALAAAGGAFAIGTTLAWTSPTEMDITKGAYGFDVDKSDFSLVGSIYALGAAIICLPVGSIINIIGRKLTMLAMVVPFSIGWAMLIWPQNMIMLYIGRFLLGLASGAICVAAPLYTGEIAHKSIRGTLGSFFQLMITVGILFVNILGTGLKLHMLTIVCALMPLIFGIVFVFMPESPTFLVKRGKIENAEKSLRWLCGPQFDVNPEISEIRADEQAIKENQISVRQALCRRATLKALMICLGLMFFQQLCGVNAVIFYTGTIFEASKTSISATTSSVIVAIMQVIATFVSTVVVDRLGRRLLLLTSGVLVALSTLALGIFFHMKSNSEESVANISWLPLTSLCLFIIMFSFGFGPVPWLMLGELFASDIKGLAGSIAGTVNWTLAFVVTKTFKDLNNALGMGATFWLFSGITVLGVFFIAVFVPETKGKSLNQIQEELEGKK